ncbi:MAG: hypothetical protein EVA89_02470 [Sandaracinaceae bacterium]|nr:MAG: hypothetical protein EVA89_02470 [Sandaracinaceae bacterium]
MRPVTTSSVVPIVLAPLALSAAFGAGYLLALDEGRTAEAPRAERPAIDAREDLGDGRAGLILRDVDGLAAEQRVEVLARSLTQLPGLDPGALAHSYLVATPRGRRWVPGDVLAVEESGLFNHYGGVDYHGDLDGDGVADRVWHATRHRSRVEDPGRDEAQGWLVFEGRGGLSRVELGSSDGWGNGEAVPFARFVDIVGGPTPDLLLVVDTSVCEVGPDGHRVRVLQFDDGEPEQVLDHRVDDPVVTGLSQSRIGRVHIDLRRGVLRADVVVMERGGDRSGSFAAMHLERHHYRRTRTEGFAHRTERLPVRAADGAIVEAFRGPDPGLGLGDQRTYRVRTGGRARWRSRVQLADARFDAVFQRYPEENPDFVDWIEGLY